MQLKIVSITEGTLLNPTMQRFDRSRIVTFMVGNHGPFQINIPSEEFTSARVSQLLEEQAQQIRALFPQG